MFFFFFFFFWGAWQKERGGSKGDIKGNIKKGSVFSLDLSGLVEVAYGIQNQPKRRPRAV